MAAKSWRPGPSIHFSNKLLLPKMIITVTYKMPKTLARQSPNAVVSFPPYAVQKGQPTPPLRFTASHFWRARRSEKRGPFRCYSFLWCYPIRALALEHWARHRIPDFLLRKLFSQSFVCPNVHRYLGLFAPLLFSYRSRVSGNFCQWWAKFLLNFASLIFSLIWRRASFTISLWF